MLLLTLNFVLTGALGSGGSEIPVIFNGDSSFGRAPALSVFVFLKLATIGSRPIEDEG